jgi:hypothetical protein
VYALILSFWGKVVLLSYLEEPRSTHKLKETKSKDVVYGIPTYALREKIYLFTTFKPRYHSKHRAGRVITTLVK